MMIMYRLLHQFTTFFLFLVVAASVVLLNGFLVITTSAQDYNPFDFSIQCGNGGMIQYPFYSSMSVGYRSGSYYCGYPGLSAKCSSDGFSGTPIITLSNRSYYYVLKFDGVRVVDLELDAQSCPQPTRNFSIQGPAASSLSIDNSYNNKNVTFFYNCTTLPNHLKPNLPCIHKNTSTACSVALFDSEIPNGSTWAAHCQHRFTIPLAHYIFDEDFGGTTNYTEILKRGTILQFQRSADCSVCENSGGQCWHNKNTSAFVGCVCSDSKLYSKRCPEPQATDDKPKRVETIGLYAGVGGSLLIVLLLTLIYRRRCLMLYKSLVSYRVSKLITSPTNVELFLQSYRSHSLQQYKYSAIKKMTNSFKDTLGQGGYGSVFKGKLLDGRIVAVKLLNDSKGNGEEFINEVATIGGTNHVNVVTLIGFCIEGTKRALVYEFMVNGSLEKFIFNQASLSTTTYAPALGWETLYQIALGIARGLDYLHRSCNNRILHFDIKPHNILLDSDFVPKISDFGLAKLSQTRESVVSVIGTRGTRGYIAPELICRNFGLVSYKSDVYSYGMMLFEMVGGRKNLDATMENMSEIYFPHWIYNHLIREKKIEGTEEFQINISEDIFKDETAKKMIIVALWCIQAHPTDRPSMKKVIEMLEGTNEELEIPPNPSIDPRCEPSPQIS